MISAEQSKTGVLERAIPSSGEKLPVIGLGSWQVFDVGSGQSDHQPLEEVLARFVALGGKVVDSSPMYGRAEQVIGEIAAKLGLRDSLFLATKVWTTGKDEGVASMERSLARFQTKRLDLIQVHNLVDVQTQLASQFLLKWIVAHPAVTCAIPATGNVRHLEDNMRAGLGRLPDGKQRQRMVERLARV